MCKVLDDDLARELYAEDTRLLAERHGGKVATLQQWAEERATYLAQPEDVSTVLDPVMCTPCQHFY